MRLMKLKVLRQIPVVDDQGRVVDLKLLEEMIQLAPQDNWVMLMGGGLGTRLRPLTDDCPKPLLKVGNKPVLETILENFIEYGFQKILHLGQLQSQDDRKHLWRRFPVGCDYSLSARRRCP